MCVYLKCVDGGLRVLIQGLLCVLGALVLFYDLSCAVMSWTIGNECYTCL